ncbi:hypothetical protein YC2023_117584 [Brassica napus]
MIGEEQEKLDLFHRHCQDEDPAGVNMQPMLNLPSSVYFIIGYGSELRIGELPDRETKCGCYRCTIAPPTMN